MTLAYYQQHTLSS